MSFIQVGGIHKGNRPNFHKTPVFSFVFLLGWKPLHAHTRLHQAFGPVRTDRKALKFKLDHGSDGPVGFVQFLLFQIRMHEFHTNSNST